MTSLSLKYISSVMTEILENVKVFGAPTSKFS